MKRRMTRQREREREETSFAVIFTKSLPLMVSMRSDARVPVSKYVCTRVRGAIPHMRACSVHRPMHDACTRSRERYGEGRDEEEGDGERRREEGEGGRGGGGGLVRRTHTGCTGVNYASREMSNCSPYRKIYNSALCGKHYVLSQSFLHSALPPDRPSFSHPMSPPSVHPLTGPPRALVPVSHPRTRRRRRRQSRFANKFARHTAIVLTSNGRSARSLPEIHFSVGGDITRGRRGR